MRVRGILNRNLHTVVRCGGLVGRLGQVPCRLRHRLMADSPLLPPAAVRGMTQLDRAAFRRPLDVCALRVPRDNITAVCKLVKAQMLRVPALRPVQTAEELEPGLAGEEAGGDAAQKVVLLDPGQVKGEHDLPWPGLRQLGLETAVSFCRVPLALTYENYRADVVLRAVLPGDQDGCTSFSRVGHLIHLNLKEHLLPYGRLIGAVLMDKHSGVRTVVNKLNTIDNTFRNFSMELLAGEPDYVVDARENGCGFRMDFSQVYWNPRLCTEHERVVALLRRGDTLLDVFAGVGPFAVPAARKGCRVLANDLNPESARWLRHNVQANKVAERVQTFNMDGREFIRTEVKRAALEFLTEKPDQAQMHAVLNLPALAIEFVDAFVGLLSTEELPEGSHLPLRAHVYTFTKELEAAEQSVRATLNANLGRDVTDHVQEVFMVRNVAPNKLMYRITWDVPRDVLCALAAEPARKRLKIGDE